MFKVRINFIDFVTSIFILNVIVLCNRRAYNLNNISEYCDL